ncbi:MAG: Tol biopolymer transporter periplasmic protein [Synechococcus sp. ELA619]
MQACSLPWGIRRQPSPGAGLGLGAESRQDPALSGDGRLLASLVLRSGRSTVLLQDRRSGQTMPLPLLRGQQPHSSPSLSWNGRYLALLVWRGGRRQVVVNARATNGRLPLPLRGDRDPQRLNLAADARHLAVDVVDGGQSRVEVFGLGERLERGHRRGRQMRLGEIEIDPGDVGAEGLEPVGVLGKQRLELGRGQCLDRGPVGRHSGTSSVVGRETNPALDRPSGAALQPPA